MKIERPDYYSKFTCTADKCGDTCCRGWEVDIDDDANEYYQLAPGEFAKEVRASIREEETRYYIEAGDYSQQDLSLSCPAVAEIFFAEDGPISYTLTEDEGAEDTLSEDEKQRLQTILAARDQKVKDIQSKPFAWELAAPRRRAAAGAFAAALGTDSGAAGEVDVALLSALQRCEPIGAGWSKQLSMLQQLIQDESHLDTLTGEFIACAGEKAQGWYSIDEWFEERETAEVLCRRSLRAVFLLCLLRFETKGQFDAEDMADIAHSYSREIEHRIWRS